MRRAKDGFVRGFMGAERIFAGLAMTLLGCASIAGVGADAEERPAEADAPAPASAATTGTKPTTSPTQPDADPDAGTTSPPRPTEKRTNGSACTDDDQCLSDRCDDDICKKKPSEPVACFPTGGPCYEDDLCCTGNYCKFFEAKCTKCKDQGETPDGRGAVTCCSGALGSNGKCS